MFDPFLGDHEEKSLPQIHVDEEDDKRFQADLKRAVQQSLGMYVVSVGNFLALQKISTL